MAAPSSAASLAGIVADGPLKQLKLQIDRHHDRLHALLLELAPDGRVSRRTFCRALSQLELDASDATIEALSEWLPDVRARGFALVPVSAVALRLVAPQKSAGN